ncbi:hypothetical protein OUZ56_026035 [Daphnia magna]|uniref:Uncharacterized protein n=1 Tax=Daphnia magna TaxID=35525 RepID=A0ABQ9ZLL2_9CRUS|nr:hypothetical protein OUZ56_026035 [Daphnia magna]
MRAPSRPQKTTRQRMAHATPVAPKAKLGKPSFFNTLGKSILTTFSPKSAERRQPAVDDDCYSVDDYYEDENDYLVEPKPLPGNSSFEEDRAAFLSRGDRGYVGRFQERIVKQLTASSSTPWTLPLSGRIDNTTES